MESNIFAEEQYAVIIITPDAMRDGLEEKILGDLHQLVQMRILWSKYWEAKTVEMVMVIYPNLRERSSYPSVIRTMMLGECRVLLVVGEDDIYLKLKSAKGSFRYDGESVQVTGLREKYRTWSQEEVRAMGFRSEEALNRIFEYRLHTTDSRKKTAVLCALCMNSEELAILREIAPELYMEVIRERCILETV